MAYIPLEQPTGAIDGANKVYTLANNISQLDHVFIDGLIYLGSYSFSGAVVTVGDAPTVSIYIDYYDSPPAPPAPVAVPGFISVQDAYDALKRRLKDISDVSQEVFIEWCNYINQFIYREVIATDPERLIQVVQISTVPGQQGYELLTLAPDFRDVSTWGTGVFTLDGQGNPIQDAIVQTGYGSRTFGYYITGDQSTAVLNFTPIPTQVKTYNLRYIPIPPEFYYMGDYFTLDKTIDTARIVPQEFLRFLVEALATLYFVWDEDVASESYQDARFVRALDEFVRQIRKQPAVYALSDFSLTF